MLKVGGFLYDKEAVRVTLTTRDLCLEFEESTYWKRIAHWQEVERNADLAEQYAWEQLEGREPWEADSWYDESESWYDASDRR